MAKRITVVVSQGQSANPAKRNLEEELVGGLLMERGIEVTVIPNLYDLAPDGTGMLCLQGITGDMIVASWLYPRAAFWTLDRNGIRGRWGVSLMKGLADEDEDEDDEDEQETADKAAAGERHDGKPVPDRRIWCLDLRAGDQGGPYIEEIRRIAAEATVQTVDLMGFIGGAPKPAQLERYLTPASGNVNAGNAAAGNGHPHGNGAAATPPVAAGNGLLAEAPAEVVRVVEDPSRRWYPVIDFSRCTNCMECLDFCLFGVYGVDRAESILVEQPDNCRKGCPACSRVCPENAIIFPQHKTPAIAGSPDGAAGGFKIDLSKLFGAPDALEQAVLERDVELVAVGRDAVGDAIGVPKRQEGRDSAPKDDLDSLMDQLDSLDL